MIYVLLISPMLYTHTATLTNCIVLATCLTGSYIIGAALLIPVKATQSFISVSHAALSVFIGSLVYSMALFLFVGSLPLILLLSAIAILLLFVFRREVTWSFTPGTRAILAFVTALCVVTLISGNEITKQFMSPQAGGFCYASDSYYFTAMVRSLRSGSIFNAAYEIHSPLNYQILGFFIPALWANMLNITSHQALWGLAGPFYKLLAVLLPYELFYNLLKDKVRANNYGFVIVSILLPILMAPLHPLYILKGEVRNFVFNGCGFLLPSGSITYPFTIILFIFCLLVFSTADWTNRKTTAEKVFFTIGLSVMILGKTPLYFAFILFMGAIIIKRVIIDKEPVANYIGYVLGFALLSFVLFKLCLGQSSGDHTFFKYGYLATLFSGWYHKTGLNAIMVIFLILFTYIFWMGIRLVGFVSLVRSDSRLFNEFFWGGLVSLLGTTVLASFMHIEMESIDRSAPTDVTFNMQQFIRSSFYILSIVSAIGILRLLYGNEIKRKYQVILFVITGIWCALSLAAIFSYTWSQKIPCEDVWYEEVYAELKTGKYNDGLIAVNPAVPYCGIMVASCDYGTYWTAMDRGDGSYNSSSKNSYRWMIFKNLIDHPEEKELIKMKSEGVKYIISSGYDSAKMTNVSALFPRYIHKVKGSAWIYEID